MDFGNDRVEAVWCVDSDTGEELLIDLTTNKILAKRLNGKIVDLGEPNVDVRNDVSGS